MFKLFSKTNKEISLKEKARLELEQEKLTHQRYMRECVEYRQSLFDRLWKDDRILIENSDTEYQIKSIIYIDNIKKFLLSFSYDSFFVYRLLSCGSVHPISLFSKTSEEKEVELAKLLLRELK